MNLVITRYSDASAGESTCNKESLRCNDRQPAVSTLFWTILPAYFLHGSKLQRQNQSLDETEIFTNSTIQNKCLEAEQL